MDLVVTISGGIPIRIPIVWLLAFGLITRWLSAGFFSRRTAKYETGQVAGIVPVCGYLVSGRGLLTWCVLDAGATGERMHSLGRATLVVGTETPAGDGTTGALRCVIEDRNGKRLFAYLKCGAIEEVMSEALAALLLSGWGLSVPAPYLVTRGPELCFASVDTSYPSLKKRFNIDALPAAVRDVVLRQAARLVCSFKSAPLAAACDEAVGNFDRNFGNVLWDGTQESWIDHAYCFGYGGQDDANKICIMAVAIDETERMQRSALASALTLDRMMTVSAKQEFSASAFDADSMIEFVDLRLNQIGQLILARFPQPNDLLKFS